MNLKKMNKGLDFPVKRVSNCKFHAKFSGIV